MSEVVAPQNEPHEHDLGLQYDLKVLNRRRVLGLLGAFGAASVLSACGSDDGASSGTSPNGPRQPLGGGMGQSNVVVAAGEIPEETAGPYPGDGSNGPNVLTADGVVRSDITSSFGDATGVAQGVPLTLKFRVYDLTGDDIAVLPGAAVYAWHCDRAGNYSMYDGDAEGENYLRGVQVADDDGWLEFRTIFPGCYAGRWPHVHFEVYESLDRATSAEHKLRTSQLAFPKETCETVYAEPGYEQSVTNLAGISLERDGIFSDGYSLQLAKVTGDISGYTATLNVPI